MTPSKIPSERYIRRVLFRAWQLTLGHSRTTTIEIAAYHELGHEPRVVKWWIKKNPDRFAELLKSTGMCYSSNSSRIRRLDQTVLEWRGGEDVTHAIETV